ncbi:cell division and transport-associated protein TolA [Shimia abyssi]|uniref:Cell division and transport-associated protein TolA n=1 Tax=Shimia abyssi TaxID=1662395 RepID=A0A2P8FE15_9RHOB|nr:cell division and transport-associated protein TolA [Shimia abyssi]
MHIGHYISGVAHTGLIGWVLFGGAFQSEPPPLEVTGVSVITAEEYQAVLRAQEAPAPSTDIAVPIIPEAELETPDLSSATDAPVETPSPPSTEAAEPDATPDLSDLTAPEPQDVTEEAPVLLTPEVDTAVVVPDVSPRPVVRPAPRVAPQPVAQPEPDVTIDDEVRESTEPDTAGETQEEVVEETAPEAASTEIATEANEDDDAPVASAAPTRSVRPRTRPVARAEPSTGTDAAVAAALAEAGAEESTPNQPTAPSGPPLTSGEKDALRVSVQNCWVVDVGSRAADVTVTVGFSLDRDGRVQGDIRLINAEGGDEAAARTAFQSARRAVLRCQKTGYELPVEKYDHWRDIEITFNPDAMRRR